MTYAQGERMGMFLDLERLGLLGSYYPASVAVSRTREARKLGLAANDPGIGGLDAEVGPLLQAYAEALDRNSEVSAASDGAAGAPTAAEAAGAPAARPVSAAPEPLPLEPLTQMHGR